jgi:hypothetical protein
VLLVPSLVKENFMRIHARIAALSTLICLALPIGSAHAAPTPKAGHGMLVIVFKDGHRQSFSLSDIERVEFPASAAVTESGSAASVNSQLPSRGHFIGKWECGDGSGNNFYITLQEGGEAWRSLGHMHGHWNYVDGEAQITWEDGAQDAIRKVGPNYQKFAYSTGKSFTDTADNVANARNTTPHPI